MKRSFQVILFLAIFLFNFSIPAFCQKVYLMGEDAVGFNGLVITVNQLDRAGLKGGLGIQGKKDSVELQISFVNTGKFAIQIDPPSDFRLTMDQEYKPGSEPGKFVLDKPFTLHPGTQSRGTLAFRVETSDNKSVPILILDRRGAPLKVCCDQGLAKIIEKKERGEIDFDQSVKLSQFFIDNFRAGEAEKLVNQNYSKYPGNPVVVLQLAAIKRLLGKTQEATELFMSVAEHSNMGREDAVDLARKAFESGEFEASRKILEPLAEKGLLGDKDLILLGRCWYFDGRWEEAGKLLKDLEERGIAERTLFFTLGNLADKQNSLDQAIKWWEKTLLVDPSHYEAMFNIGVAAYKLDDRMKAKECWRKVLGMNPDFETRKIAEDALEKIK